MLPAHALLRLAHKLVQGLERVRSLWQEALTFSSVGVHVLCLTDVPSQARAAIAMWGTPTFVWKRRARSKGMFLPS